jgi:Transglutaminase-like superfamily
MRERLRRFRSLAPSARAMFMRAALLLPVVSFSLRWRGFRATQSMLRKLLRPDQAGFRSSSQSSAAAHQSTVKQTVRMVEAAARNIWRSSTCLEKSLTIWWLLARQGARSTVRIGARKRSAEFEAHAWVECDGVALNEPEEPHRHYAAFDAEFTSLSAEAP